jgi:hypothetical protein
MGVTAEREKSGALLQLHEKQDENRPHSDSDRKLNELRVT